MRNSLASFFCGALFSVGLAVSGMTRPSKVLGFLDVAGHFDPSLLLVMVSGIAVYALAWRLTRALGRPLLGGAFPPPPPTNVDARLIGGSVLFGLGWGLAGFCPGPAIESVASGMHAGLVFVAAMAAGMALYPLLDRAHGRVDEAQALGVESAGPASIAR